jgi:hypothetical protein
MSGTRDQSGLEIHLPFWYVHTGKLAGHDAPNAGELSINSLPLQGTDFLRFVAWFSF